MYRKVIGSAHNVISILISVRLMQNARPPLPTACPVKLSHLINRCWSSNPDKRPYFDEIISILEDYSEAFEQDPTFFSSYEPTQHRTLVKSITRCISVHKSALKA